MIEEFDLNDMKLVLEVLLLQQTAYRIEAELIGLEEVPPLLDSPQTLKDSGETFFVYRSGERIAGAASCKQTAKELLICRMMVHPECFRQGIADALLTHMERLAVPGMKLKVTTGTRNLPAMQLYAKHGFEPEQQLLLAPGVTLTVLAKYSGSSPRHEIG
ncbi:GNAT family N-acetyltransferase [Paenibacillus sp. GD4]|uniref:GNAT family N-acetyltransferase n=1 Tax=Paenibacillus sp. GD4 TaxID=3068890 RepID=UPI0027963E40|nr:GNAT family N-acetyltransferase [Paenibacillus sp. GD4]MDQ1911869.1 GNAT family N-acetyltransferase [Paenibacillus sp. GD4]